MSDKCPKCEFWLNAGAKYCRDCGRNLQEERKNRHPSAIHILVQLTVTIVIFIILCNTIYTIVNFNSIYEEASKLSYAVCISFGPIDYVFFKFTGIAVGVVLATLLITQISCLGFAIYRYIAPLKKEIRGEDGSATDRTGLSMASAGLAMSLFFTVVYFIISGLFGHTVDASWMDEYSTGQLSFMLTRAGVREELMFRVFEIGLPMMVITAIFLKEKKCWHYLFGGFGMSKVAFAIMLISSTMFGFAHLNGWGWTKVFDAAFAGFIFAYIYVEYGLYASIIAHTANDTISSIGYLGLFGIESMASLSLIGLGLVVIIYWIIKPNYDAIDPRKMPILPEKIDGSLLDQWKRH